MNLIEKIKNHILPSRQLIEIDGFKGWLEYEPNGDVIVVDGKNWVWKDGRWQPEDGQPNAQVCKICGRPYQIDPRSKE